MCDKQLARIGIFFLKEAVLDVLLKVQPETLGPAEISRHLKIHPYAQTSLVRHILFELENEGRVVGEGREWQITEQEASERCDSSVSRTLKWVSAE